MCSSKKRGTARAEHMQDTLLVMAAVGGPHTSSSHPLEALQAALLLLCGGTIAAAVHPSSDGRPLNQPLRLHLVYCHAGPRWYFGQPRASPSSMPHDTGHGATNRNTTVSCGPFNGVAMVTQNPTITISYFVQNSVKVIAQEKPITVETENWNPETFTLQLQGARALQIKRNKQRRWSPA